MSRINKKKRIFDLGCSMALELMGVIPPKRSCSGIGGGVGRGFIIHYDLEAMDSKVRSTGSWVQDLTSC